MFYEAELRLLRDTFRKCRVSTGIYDPASAQDAQSLTPHTFLTGDADPAVFLKNVLREVQPATVYRLRDPFDCRYIFLKLPELPGEAVLVIGPFLASPPSDRQLLELAERLDISPSRQKQLSSFIAGLPLVPDNSHLYVLIESFCEHLWGVSGFSVEYLDRDPYASLPLLSENSAASTEEDALFHMKNMEQRYSYENELMRAVSKGQLHKAHSLLGGFSTFLFEQRLADPLRNAKNYCIIMNTLLRKAAEQGGVHPMYLDKVSSAYAVQIEQLHSLDNVLPLMTEMFRAYCRLVRKHATQDYSPPVQQALLFVESNLSGDLNLRMLAQKLNISSSYLSTIFKKETGQTLTDFIAQRRVDKAMDLLRSTRLQVQTVAQHCGIVDVHYFSKIFKKVTGMTPKAYRDSLKR
ncbi:MAG: AraC family transcriptional regulator [Oscillospiraceae bacterium]|nr:AraC family transcriptional regulator [Oscillospiraceae bacterium]